ncbi:hypothetical protein BKA82DRAFT_996577 [Pisolithus tinctorius]|uniref:Uncharacterized protein n=1 Tax=Pisolithus tinctorius Marx 270 TaxID=870435 RepID=A0A0C3P8D1_PISTI|nr:hypothetical protein BKA82DRAFT_996577 [Pisolithus tinctorius]KIO09730.1 hypothetical protein M404DRAFT_996577 [Pisolithus tinctorius Marx 270]
MPRFDKLYSRLRLCCWQFAFPGRHVGLSTQAKDHRKCCTTAMARLPDPVIGTAVICIPAAQGIQDFRIVMM